jgi:hypothetical protein
LQQRYILLVTQEAFVFPQDKCINIDVIGHFELVGTIAVLTIPHYRSRLPLHSKLSRGIDDDCGVSAAIGTPKNKFSLLVSHSTAPFAL